MLEAQAVEEPAETGEEPMPEPDRLPARSQRAEIDALRGEVLPAAIAAAGGLVAGAATVAAMRAVRGGGMAKRSRGRNLIGRRPGQQSIIASRSFLVDVHVLGSRR